MSDTARRTICVMEILDPSGHVELKWDPDDAESVKRAEAEFERMREAGFAFFTSASPDADALDTFDAARPGMDGRLVQPATSEAPLVQTRKFKRRARRTVAVQPMRGG